MARFWGGSWRGSYLEPGKSVLSWTLQVKSGSGTWGRPGSPILGSR